ncbi:MAG: TRC40/GET3/ArsA family transport-energizing ATPase [archaeon]|nr:TRC40/GET3/ArsA family transport-energizing ATPase [archaeon]
MKLLVFGGKGGVGKSSISAATAVKIADIAPNKNILIISFDIAHNLSDLYAIEVGNELTQITENLYAIEPDADKYAEEYTKEFAQKMRLMMKSMPIVGMIPSLEEFIEKTFTANSIPLSLKNSMFFQRLLDADEVIESVGEGFEDDLSKMKFDYVIADFPPTGNMIALFEVPQNTIQVLLKYSLQTMSQIRSFMKGIKKVTTIFNPFARQSSEDQKNLSREILRVLKHVEERGERVTELLKNEGSLRLVSIAEKPSFEEIKRGSEISEKYISIDAVHINRIIQDKYIHDCEMCRLQRENQNKYIGKIKETFKNKKVWLSHRLTKVPIGLDGLNALADEVYGKEASLEEIINPLP